MNEKHNEVIKEEDKIKQLKQQQKEKEEEQYLQSLLGSLCTVRGSDSIVRRGQLLEVRYLWTPTLLNENIETIKLPPPLFGFVRVKDVDHRLSGWFPVDDIELKESRNNNNNNNSNNSFSVNTSGNMSASSNIITRITKPILSSVYTEVTPGMTRTRREGKQLDFFDERLLRDCRTPTTIRYFVYLCNFVFSPWYYAPYGIFHGEYNPLAPSHKDEQCRFKLKETLTNPFIRDAYLCPFSLRIYSTFEQMQYETKQYRYARLKPPGQEIYRDDARGFSMFEVNGNRQVTYCRHLFLLGKSFLENKLAGHDVHNYYFYVVCLHQRHFPNYTDDPSAVYFVGYFTWEKQVVDNNLACIVTLPCFAGGASQSNNNNNNNNTKPTLSHFGQFMIAASYELAYRRKHVGSPEKPLSDLGASAYDRYWRSVLVRWMHTLLEKSISVIIVSDNNEEIGSNGGPPLTPGRNKKRNNSKSRNKNNRSNTNSDIDDNDNSENEDETENENEGGETSGNELPLQQWKRPRRSNSFENKSNSEDENNNNNNSDAASSQQSTDTFTTMSLRAISKEIKLEEADVSRTLLNMGLLHRNAEDRSLRLVIPVAFVRREFAKAKENAKDLTRAEFNPKLLIGKASAPFTAAVVSARLQQQQQQQQQQQRLAGSR